VGDDVDVGAVDRVQRPPGQLGLRLAARDVDRRHDDVEPGEEVVREVERTVRADLELAAVKEAEAFGRRLRRRRTVPLLPLEPLVERGDDRALLLDAIRGQAAGDRQ
jgi:hypothetical protein